jgi:hypothetical protein
MFILRRTSVAVAGALAIVAVFLIKTSVLKQNLKNLPKLDPLWLKNCWYWEAELAA